MPIWDIAQSSVELCHSIKKRWYSLAHTEISPRLWIMEKDLELLLSILEKIKIGQILIEMLA